jgi:hypothetical protein
LADLGKLSGLNISQIPFTNLEKERFSYFYKDQLTGIYNSNYLWMVVQGLILYLKFNCFFIVEIHWMTNYNLKNNWHMGNTILKKFEMQLLKLFEEEQIFRVFRYDFVVCFSDIYSRENFLKNWYPLQIETVSSLSHEIERKELLNLLV